MAVPARQRSVTFADSAAADDADDGPPLASNGVNSEEATSRPLHNYWQALRPWSFTASLTPVVLGAALAYRCSGLWPPVSWPVLALSCLTAISVHAAGNLVNTYYDYTLGVDSVHHWCDDRTLVDKLLTPREVELLAPCLYAVGTAAFVATVIFNGGRFAFAQTIIFVLGMSGSFFYTGGGTNALKYKALGELLVFTVFGPVTVAFAFFAQHAAATSNGGAEEDLLRLLWLPLVYASPLAINTVAILHANNFRDADSERQLSVITVAICLGPFLSRLLLAALLLLPFLIFAMLALHSASAFLLPLLAVVDALPLVGCVTAVKSGSDPAFRKVTHRIARHNLILGCLYVFAILLAPQQIFVSD